MSENIKRFIYKHKVVYKNIEKVYCPYIDDFVYFTSSGFKHLLWKHGRGMRTVSEIIRRLCSINSAILIISKSGTLQEYELSNTEFFCFIAIINSVKYKVVISKTRESKYKFVSVIPKWKTGKRDNKKPSQ